MARSLCDNRIKQELQHPQNGHYLTQYIHRIGDNGLHGAVLRLQAKAAMFAEIALDGGIACNHGNYDIAIVGMGLLLH